LNVNLNINNENQDCKIGTVYAGRALLVGRGMKEGDEGDSIWLMDFIYLYETELKKPLAIALVGWGGG
jgi:hypothetical protein